ncbi:MAG: D-aminoacyl-tRNA deacylase [Bacillota bacterium]|jgi:D-tyrosyl-tRNA(Tyr) deacylase
MRAVVQRVLKAAVTLQQTGETVGQIGRGFVVLLGVGNEDTEADSKYLAEKIANLRVFEDEYDKMNLSLLNVGGEILAVSQFTLFGDCRRGRRPGFTEAARPENADPLYQHFVGELRKYGIKVETGVFQTDMLVDIANDGPVTLLLDSKKVF